MKYINRHELAVRASDLRMNMTYVEKKLWYGFLRNYEIPFVTQKVIGRYIVDFYSRKVRLCIELDGGHHYRSFERNYDEQRTRFLEMNEIKVLRFSNNEVIEEFEGVCELIHYFSQIRRNDLIEIDIKRLLNKK